MRRPVTSPKGAASRRSDAITPRAVQAAPVPFRGSEPPEFPPKPLMSRRRRLGDTESALAAKRRRPELPGEGPRPDGSPAAVEAALRAVTELFPRRLFGDALPPLVLRHQLYDVVRDRTAVDRHLNRLRDEGRVRLLHLGLGSDALGVVSLELYREKALAAVAGTPREGLVRRFLDGAVAATPELSFEQGRMRELGFGDRDVTQLVAAGLLTVRDAGSWWLAVPGVGRFVRALLRGRRALLALVRRSRHREVPLRDLQGGKTPPGARLGVPFLLHDLLGAEQLQSVPTAAGPLLRLADS